MEHSNETNPSDDVQPHIVKPQTNSKTPYAEEIITRKELHVAINKNLKWLAKTVIDQLAEGRTAQEIAKYVEYQANEEIVDWTIQA